MYPANPIVPRLRAAVAACAAGAALAACGMGPSVETVALEATVLTDSVSLALPTGLMVWQNSLVVQDPRAASAVRIFDTAGRLRGSTGRKGFGPGEFSSPSAVLPRPGHPGEFWVFDSRLSRLTPFRVPDLLAGGTQHAGQRVQLASPLVVEAPVWLDDSTLVAQNAMLRAGDKRFSFLRQDGALRASAGEEPASEEKLTRFLKQQVYGGPMAARPGHPQFLVASRYAGRLELYGTDGALVRRFDVPQAFEPDVEPTPDGVNFFSNEGQRVGYPDVAVTDRLVFALFSGQKDKDNPESMFAREVHVFGWDGRLRHILALDNAVLQIALSDDGRTLYAVRHEPYPQVLAYPLPAFALPAET